MAGVITGRAKSVGTWRTHPAQPSVSTYQRRSGMSGGEVNLAEMVDPPKGQAWSARAYERGLIEAATTAENERIAANRANAKRERKARAQARKKNAA